MRSCGRVTLIVLLVVTGHGAAAYAQGSGHFNRVTTTAFYDARTGSTAYHAERAGEGATRSCTVARAEFLRPYSSRTLNQNRSSASHVSAGSSWENEPQSTATKVNLIARSRPRTYYPSMRPGLAIQQPVTLTAQAIVFGPTCTCSRNSPMSGAGHHR